MPQTFHRAHSVALLLIICMVLACLGVPANAFAAATPRLIVGFAKPTAVTTQAAALTKAGVVGASSRSVASRDIPQLRVAIVAVPRGDIARVRANLLRRTDVRFVEIDRVARAYDLTSVSNDGVAVAGADLAATWRPNDSYLSQQWALTMMGASQAWDYTRGSGAKVAVVDTGVDYIHPDLRGRVELGYDFVDRDSDPMDVQGHGTHVAGIVAANADNGYGVVGIAPSAKVLAVRVLDAEGSGNYSQVANGIVYAADQGADVINLSLGGPAGAEVLRSAVLYAASRGAVVTCATGNDGADTIGYPARYDGCVAVGATDRYDKRAGFSNRGSGIDITAPGAQVLSTTIGSGHEAWDGTSMATPYVSGVAALLVSQGLRRRAVIDTLRATARDLGASGADTTFGAGRVDAGAAVLAASRQPRALADDVAPTITSVTRGAVERTVKTTYKTKWKVTRRTAWARVGSTDYLGVYSWRRTSTAGTRRTIRYFRMRGGVVYGRTVRQRKTRVAQHAVTSRLPIRVVSSDNVDVDRVALQIDGRTVGVDWSSSDGWMIPVNCSAASHTLTAWAYDAADNEVGARVVMSLAC